MYRLAAVDNGSNPHADLIHPINVTSLLSRGIYISAEDAASRIHGVMADLRRAGYGDHILRSIDLVVESAE